MANLFNAHQKCNEYHCSDNRVQIIEGSDNRVQIIEGSDNRGSTVEGVVERSRERMERKKDDRSGDFSIVRHNSFTTFCD